MQTGGRRSGVVVSTLAEARMLQAEGFSDVLYAVPLGVDKVPLACQLAADLPDFQVLVDGAHVLAALAAAAASVKLSQPLGVWIKIDCGYGRAGLPPTATDHLVAIVRQLEQSTVLRFAGRRGRAC